MNPPAKRRQHTVPRFYLRRFANNTGQVMRVELPGTKRHPISVGNAGVVNDFYLIEGGGAEANAFEDGLAALEGRAAAAFTALIEERQWPLDAQVRAAIAEWAAAQHLRTVAARQAGDELTDAAVKALIAVGGRDALRQVLEGIEGRAVADSEVEEAWQVMTSFDEYRIANPRGTHLEAINRGFAPLAVSFYQRGWQIVRFTDASLLTTDTPIVLMRGFGEDPYTAVGSMTAAGVLTALDRRVALVMTEPGDDDLQLPGDADLARALDQSLVSGARRVVFHHPDDDPLQGVQIPEPREREVETGPLPETD